MKEISFRLVATTGIVILVVISVLFVSSTGWLDSQPVNAQSATPDSLRTITVVGEGRVTIDPDIAQATIGVEVVGPSVIEASSENRQTLENVLAALKEQGIAERDLQTTGFSIFAERFGPEGPLAESDVRYRVSNNVSVKIRDLDSVGTVLDAAIEAGANNIFGVNFSVDDPGSLEFDARQGAVEDARAKAEELAALTGVNVGEVVSVSEIIGGAGYLAGNFSEQAAGRLGGGGGGAPISPGELDLLMQLQVTYMITE